MVLKLVQKRLVEKVSFCLCEDRLRNDLYCVGWGVKLYSIQSRRNCSSELAALVAGGKLFHARAAAAGNARSPMVERRVDGTCSVIAIT